MKSLLITLILICTQELYCKTDSLVKFSDIKFRSETEKTAFINFQNAYYENPQDLFITAYGENSISSRSISNRIETFITENQKKLACLNSTGKVKFLYKEVHKEFLKVYKLKNSFADIFEKGEYNCVSASALYAIIFQKTGIPYQIIESPQHVYLTAYPATEKIVIETTLPEKGYFQFSKSYIEKYIKYLFEAKLITKLEYESYSASELFEKYYFSQKGVSLTELAGLQYSNYALYAEEDSKSDLAVEFMRKAYFLYGGHRHSYMLKSFLIKELNNNNYTDAKQIYNLRTLCNFNNAQDKDVGNEMISNEFLRVLNAQLINNSDYEQFQKSYNIIHSSLNDSVVKNEISFLYYYELARLGYMNYKSEAYELEHLEAAYKIKPKHANLQNMIFSYFSAVLSNQLDPQSVLNTMEKYSAKFPFLNDNAKFLSVRGNCLLELAYQSFSLNNLAKGESFLTDFEKLQESGTSEPETKFVEKAYSVAAGIYYKKGNKAKTKELLKRGLKYAPESFGLQQRLSQL